MDRRCLYLIALALCASSCGGGSGSTASAPTAPTPVVVAPVAVAPVVIGLSITNSISTLLIGQTGTLSATSSYSDGSTRSILPAWTSGNSSVVSVDGNGRLTAVGAGSVTITATAEGRSATTQVRGLPDFSGNWSVQWRQTTCDVPPRWGAGFCNISGLYTAKVNLQRSGVDGIVGSYDNGIGWIGTVSGQVATNGTLSLTGRLDSPRRTATFYSNFVSWNAQLTSGLGFTGTFSETMTWVGESQQGFSAGTMVNATK